MSKSQTCYNDISRPTILHGLEELVIVPVPNRLDDLPMGAVSREAVHSFGDAHHLLRGLGERLTAIHDENKKKLYQAHHFKGRPTSVEQTSI